MIPFSVALAVHLAVNSQIAFVPDRGTDTWEHEVVQGDCEDYVLTKRKRLLDMGFHPKNLRIALAKTAISDLHAVLVVDTDQGEYIADNRHQTLKTRKELKNYWWVAIEENRKWYSVLP